MTIAIAEHALGGRHKHPVPWKSMARVTWLQRRATLVVLLVGFVGCAVAIVLGELGTHATYASYIAGGCVAHPYDAPCQSLATSLNVDPFSAMVIVLDVLPVLIGVFVGAPLLARELESGTFRFAWTQGVGRSRAVVTTLVFLGALLAGGACALGLLLNWFAHPFEVINVESQWQSGLFDATAPMLAAWTLLALALGIFLGAVIRRTVAAMAAATAGVGGLLLASFIWLAARLESVGALATNRLAAVGLSVGRLNLPGSQYNAPAGSWLVESWFSTANGHRLTTSAAYNVTSRMYATKIGNSDPARWLAAHHLVYWVSYQPAARFWIFQLVALAILSSVSVLLAFATVRLIARRA